MNRPNGPWFWLILAGIAIVVGLCLLPSEEGKIIRRLEALANKASYAERPPKLPHVAQISQIFAEHLTNPLALDVAELGDSSYPLNELVEGFMAYSAEHSALRFRLDHLQVKVERRADRAVATGELYVESSRASGERRTELRRITATLEKRQSYWFVVHAKATEPRIDQPEARP